MNASQYVHTLYTPDGMEGISACSVCGGGEGALPTLCPGRTLTSEELDAIYAARLDFCRQGPMSHAAPPGWWRRLEGPSAALQAAAFAVGKAATYTEPVSITLRPEECRDLSNFITNHLTTSTTS